MCYHVTSYRPKLQITPGRQQSISPLYQQQSTPYNDDDDTPKSYETKHHGQRYHQRPPKPKSTTSLSFPPATGPRPSDPRPSRVASPASLRPSAGAHAASELVFKFLELLPDTCETRAREPGERVEAVECEVGGEREGRV